MELSEKTKTEKPKSPARKILAVIIVLVVIAALTTAITTVFMPVITIYGNSMSPTLEAGQTAVCIKSHHYDRGDIVAFYYGKKLMVKRVIAVSGEEITIDIDGKVSINGADLQEPYVIDKTMGECDVTMPFNTPEDEYFVIGDNREVSMDSRRAAVGCVTDSQIIGKVVFKAWPFSAIGFVK